MKKGKNRAGDRRIGAVMVVGGGIGGMQAALDLAESGFKVYLTEARSAIGGHMSQLDKTFPTNDCSMCIMSPKLVECGRHRNIEVLTGAELMSLSGEAGNFTAQVQLHPRYIDISKCTGCGDCAKVCPVPRLNEYDAGLSERRAVHRLYPQATPSAFAIEKRGTAPCRDACPINQRAQGYIALIKERRYEDAYRTIKEDNPFPAICGRVCNHGCEDACSRNKLDGAVSVMALKRFVADWAYSHPSEARVETVAPAVPSHRVAVVGAGPAGLTCAQDLVRMGYGATVFEALPVAGGMMRVGVPAHRVPRDIIQREIDDILALGVELKLSARVDDIPGLLKDGFDAVFVAIGAHRGKRLPIPGADLPQVQIATDFLQQVSLGERVEIGEDVLVLGGGNVAIDTAMTALRLGASRVKMACLECRDTMPAHTWEVEQAEEEGIEVHPSQAFSKVMSQNGQITGVECTDVSFMQFDSEGRLTLETVPSSEHSIPCDTVIFAIGQAPDLSPLKEGIEVTRRGTIAVDPQTLASSNPGIFAGGDAVTGTAFIVDAIAAGHKAARSIQRYLGGEPLKQEEARPPVVEISEEEIAQKLRRGEVALRPRVAGEKRSPEVRKVDFEEFDLGLDEEEAVSEAERCLSCGICSECYQCVYACQRQAIDHNMVEQTVELRVGAVVLAPGYEPYDAAKSPEFGFGRYPNVVTSLQFERLLSASGPTGGHVKRPSDGERPRRVAFLQCIGSRDQRHDYCSSVCCMYATKEAIMAVEHEPDTQCHIFLMDMRAFGKGYEEYYKRARERYKVDYIRCRVSAVKEDPTTKNLMVKYQDEEGKIAEAEYDLVVLSVGMEMSESVRELGRRLGLAMDEHGFCLTPTFDPLATSRPGVYACGSFVEPKDIPETVTEASAAAAKCGQLLAASRWTMVSEPEYPPERDVSGEEPRIGVFICHCGSNIAGFLDVAGVTEYARTLPYVFHAEANLYTCSQDSTSGIVERIKEHGINRVVVASCSPRTHEPLFQDTLRQAGLNPFLFEMANIRNQCSWVHSHDWEGATQKAKELVGMAVGRAAVLEPLHWVELPVERAALVMGGGVAGMNAALSLAEQGFPVHLVESGPNLGGNLRRVHYDIYGADPQVYLEELVREVENHGLITVHKEAKLLETEGFVGNFSSRLKVKGREKTVRHGVVIVAIGGRDYKGEEYLYGRDKRVLTQGELEALIVNAPDEVARTKEIAMIQCVPEGIYCSRICCAVAVENALQIKELNPRAQVYILFKDMRTYGFLEREYEKARSKGIIFLRYRESPQVRANDHLEIICHEEALGEDMTLRPDLLILSTATLPAEEAKELSSTLKVPLDLDGFFLEAHIKLRPVDFATSGIFLCGAAHYPKLVSEAILQAQGAAARAATILSQKTLRVGGIVAAVEPEKCTACLTCVRICPLKVPEIDFSLIGIGGIKGAARIEAARCQGCGVCVAECPGKAIQLLHYKDVQIEAKIEALFALEPV